MSYRPAISIAVAAILGIACISTDALAYRGGGRVGGVRAGGAVAAARTRICRTATPAVNRAGAA
jgi:hypothetical protein